ncbi:MAG: hypothetical protein ACI85Q_000338 [Salibacteraceae bacterium]|jgi:hypothetical protein
MKKTILLLAVLGLSTTSFSQDTAAAAAGDTIPPNWTITGGVGLMLNQVGLYNWQGGGEPSFAASLLYKGTFNYKKNKFTWENYADLAYGLIQQGKNDITKSDDRWEVGTKLGHQLDEKWDLNGFATLRSQFDEGFDPENLNLKISDLMAPGYLLVGIGANFKHSDWLDINLSPATGKFTFVMNDSLATQEIIDADGVGTGKGKYGNTAGDKVRTEMGAYAKISIKKEIFENMTLSTQADFFTDYLNNFGAIDVNWNLTLLMKVNKFISATVTTNLIYDEDISIVLEKNNLGETLRAGPAVQFKETVGVGLTYTY